MSTVQRSPMRSRTLRSGSSRRTRRAPGCRCPRILRNGDDNDQRPRDPRAPRVPRGRGRRPRHRELPGPFTEDRSFNPAGAASCSGEHLAEPMLSTIAGIMPDVHRELLQVHVVGNVVAVELFIRGTFTREFQTPAGVLKGNGQKSTFRG
jgi:hypothetical protein